MPQYGYSRLTVGLYIGKCLYGMQGIPAAQQSGIERLRLKLANGSTSAKQICVFGELNTIKIRAGLLD